MRILVTGGGTGGHVTPLNPIVAELDAAFPDATIVFAAKAGDRFASLLDDNPHIDERFSIVSGKWRRYPNLTLTQKLLDVSTMFYNLRDALFIGIGCVQALFRLASNRPDIIFSKSGPASIPIGIVARLFLIPMVTHDSDLIPGWTHRLIGRWAAFNAVASKAGEYPYDADKIRYVGVPVAARFTQKITKKMRDDARKRLDLASTSRVVLVIGGSLGAKSINDAMVSQAQMLTSDGHTVLHVTGESQYEPVEALLKQQGVDTNKYRTIPFIGDPAVMFDHYLVADVVVARCGATTTAELANMGKPSILIPAKQLADQLKNAAYLKQEKAAEVLDDQVIIDSPETLGASIQQILTKPKLRDQLARDFAKQAIPDTAQQITNLIKSLVE